jgi:hypothetical protein
VVEYWRVVVYKKNQQETGGFLTILRFVRKAKELGRRLGARQTPKRNSIPTIRSSFLNQ